MVVLLGVLLVAACVAVLAMPFLRARRAGYVSPADVEAVQQVAARREAVFEELRVLRLDRDLGNVEEADYQRRFQELRLQAAVLLRDQDRLEARVEGVDAEIEREVAALRASHRGTPSPSVAASCPACGAAVSPGSARCTACSEALGRGEGV